MGTIAQWKRRVNRSLLQDPLIAEVLSPQVVDRYCRAEGHHWRESFWSPTVTLLAFLLQVLSGEKTLRAAVAEVRSQLHRDSGSPVPSGDPSAYCQARRRFPQRVLTALTDELARCMHGLLDDAARWRGHVLKIVDGTTVTTPDTPELQKAFPQPEGQKPGCGFPVVRLVALFDWATGAIRGLAVGNLRVSEVTLLRRQGETWLEAGDVLVADRHYCSYCDIARLLAREVNVILRLHQRRKADFRKGKRLGPHDQLLDWIRPKQWFPSFGIDRAAFEQLPETLAIRQIRVTHVPKGFRSRTIVLATTLLDPVAYPANEIRALYRDRWLAELNLRSLKTHLGMDVLRGQSEDVVRKEILVHMLAYNLIRLLMWRAARTHGRNLHRLSFTGTLHRLRKAMPQMMTTSVTAELELLGYLLAGIADDLLPDRPDRMEPRRRKRRPKEYSLLNKPRAWYHAHGDKDAR